MSWMIGVQLPAGDSVISYLLNVQTDTGQCSILFTGYWGLLFWW